jgi:hypothetical protein
MFLIAPELHKHVQKKAHTATKPAKTTTAMKSCPSARWWGLSPHCADHHSETTVKKS